MVPAKPASNENGSKRREIHPLGLSVGKIPPFTSIFGLCTTVPCTISAKHSLVQNGTWPFGTAVFCTNTFWNPRFRLQYWVSCSQTRFPQGGGYCSRSEPSSHRGKGDWLFGFKGTVPRAGGSSPFRTCVYYWMSSSSLVWPFSTLCDAVREQGCALCAQVRFPGSVCERCGEYYFVSSLLFSVSCFDFSLPILPCMPRQAKSPAIPKVMVETSTPPKNGVLTWKMYSMCVVTIRLWHIKVFTSLVTRRMTGVSSKWFDWLTSTSLSCMFSLPPFSYELLSATNVFIIVVVLSPCHVSSSPPLLPRLGPLHTVKMLSCGSKPWNGIRNICEHLSGLWIENHQHATAEFVRGDLVDVSIASP